LPHPSNLYEYVFSDPVNEIDPSGLVSCRSELQKGATRARGKSPQTGIVKKLDRDRGIYKPNLRWLATDDGARGVVSIQGKRGGRVIAVTKAFFVIKIACGCRDKKCIADNTSAEGEGKGHVSVPFVKKFSEGSHQFTLEADFNARGDGDTIKGTGKLVWTYERVTLSGSVSIRETVESEPIDLSFTWKCVGRC
jgi:hypothetical protein